MPRYLLPAALMAASAAGFQATTATHAGVDFERQVRPILQKCLPCHGAQQQMNGLRLDEGHAALRGGYSGAAIVAGNSASSPMILRLTSDRQGFFMPPAGDRLAAGEIATLRAWIDHGAPWPSPRKTAPAVRSSSHWSFQPLVKPAPPAVRGRSWVRNPIDAFVLSRLESEGIAPSPEAVKTTLVRRASLDLTGLPPPPELVDEFLRDSSPDAWDRLVDRLLASPHYGERWARWWLDLAHYADSDGYEKDQVRPYAWRWRHWVIEALNRDLPFDRFTIEQLAGDLLPGATNEQRVATGFLRNTLTNREAGVDRAEARFEQLVNRANTVGTVWLGLTVGCAQCHDHKYDPITQRDYYRLFAFFHAAEEENVDAPLAGEAGPYLRALPEYRKQRAELLREFEAPALQAEWEEKIGGAIREPGKVLEWDFALTSMKAMFDRAERVLKTEPARRSPRDQARLTDYFVRSPGPALGRDKKTLERLKELREKLEKLDSGFPALTQAPVMVRDQDAGGGAHLHLRGDWRQKGIPVEPGLPAVLSTAPAAPGADRLALARWLVSRENPLTARVTVNRLWQELFGRGLAATAEDFGAQGERPTHPGLLDWLAAELVDRGWSLKQFHKLLLTSATYRQSSRVRPELVSRDPDNRLLARQARLRLSAEAVRDVALAAGGLLHTAVGGPSVRPPQPAGVAELGYANSVKWKESEGTDRYRRGLYIHFQRTTPYPMLMNFDAPDSNVSCTRRQRSNTPLQALNLLNDPVFVEAAHALAWRVEQEASGGFGDRLDYAFRLCLAHPPSAEERERLGRFFDQYSGILRNQSAAAGPVSAWAAVSRVLLNLDEFITRE